METEVSNRKIRKVTFPVPLSFGNGGLHLLFESVFPPGCKAPEDRDRCAFATILSGPSSVPAKPSPQ